MSSKECQDFRAWYEMFQVIHYDYFVRKSVQFHYVVCWPFREKIDSFFELLGLKCLRNWHIFLELCEFPRSGQISSSETMAPSLELKATVSQYL